LVLLIFDNHRQSFPLNIRLSICRYNPYPLNLTG
jgi:hypothetical protein